MNQFLKNCLTDLTGKNDFDEVSIEELEKINSAHPYFAIGHLLLSKKLKKDNHQLFARQAQKTAAYIPNTFWLQYLLQPTIQADTLYPPIAAAPVVALQTLADPAFVNHGKIESLPLTPENIIEQKAGRVVLTDGDDNVETEELLHASTLLQSHVETVIQQEQLPVSQAIIAQPLPSKFEVVKEDGYHYKSLLLEDEVKPEPAIAETRNQSPTAGIIKAETNIPPTTIYESEVEESAEGEQTNEKEAPITTQFSKEEIDASTLLAEKTLAEVGSDTNGENIFFLPKPLADTAEHNLTANKNEPVLEAGKREQQAQLAAETPIESVPDLTPVKVANIEVEAVAAEPENAVEQIELAEEPEEQAVIASGIKFAESGVTPVLNETSEQQEKDIANETPEVETPPLAPPEEANSEAGDEAVYTDQQLPDGFSNDQMLKNIKSILESPQTHSTKNGNTPLVPIDPYYTVDYFASQGIKLVLEEEPGDKLAKNLKSFTQWLKHMKKVGPEEVVKEVNDTAAEATIIRIADFSNVQREVITEAMAEVLEKQGKKEKAVQVYIKLSFLYPDKSAYFANRIKILKGIK